MPVFKPEITLGTLIELLAFIVAVLGGIRKFGVLEAKLNIMYKWFEDSVLHNAPRRHSRDDEDFYKR